MHLVHYNTVIVLCAPSRASDCCILPFWVSCKKTLEVRQEGCLELAAADPTS